jgi:hypothetical protein
MFGTSKPAASLSSGLLARKGQARPAMRPQGFVGVTSPLDDLGWNDMGLAPVEVPPPPIALVEQLSPQVPADMQPVPTVLRQREVLAQELAPVAAEAVPEAEPPADAPVESKPVSKHMLARIGRETKAKKTKAAFTLRLDGDRHLRLRLASAVRNRSAQQLMTDALDAFLTTVPEAETLASQLAKTIKR